MKDPRRFYVYAHLRGKDSANGLQYSPYYIGKGSGNRAFVNRRTISAPKDKSLIVFIQEGLTEQEAFVLERYCIAMYGRISQNTGILHNRCDGGEGTSGMIIPLERRIQMAVVSREARRREGRWKGKGNPKFGGDTVRGELNPMWGRQHSEETRRTISAQIAAHYGTKEGRLANKLKAQKYLYELIDPNGEVYITDNLWEFSLQYGLANSSLNKVIHGKAKQHKGWTGKIVEALR